MQATRALLALIVAAFSLAAPALAYARADPWVRVSAQATASPKPNPWIALWTSRDRDLPTATKIAAATFGVSYDWLRSCNRSEGGGTGRLTLAYSLRHYVSGRGWNRSGSRAFGPWQFMLDQKPAPSSTQWGTFGSYVHAAFLRARARHVYVPFRFKTPDSYVGQAMTAAYMFSIGKSSHWTGAGC